MPSARGKNRRGSIDSLDGDDPSVFPLSSRLSYLKNSESSAAGVRKLTPRPSPSALQSYDVEEKKSESPDATLSHKNRLEVRCAVILH